MTEPYYVLRLWDYATPSFCSCDKMYVGSEHEIRAAIAEMEKYDRESETVKAVKAYLQGDRKAAHNIAFREVPALEECALVHASELILGGKQWNHINTWGFPYVMRCDAAKVSQILVKYNELFYRCIRVWFENLCYESVTGKWNVLGTFFLGPSYMFEVSEEGNDLTKINNLLYVIEESYDNVEEALGKMHSEECLDFRAFCDDIFGDG